MKKTSSTDEQTNLTETVCVGKEDDIDSSDAKLTIAQFETMRYLHEHTYKRILWYRAEIWKISTPLWMGFGAVTLSAWSAARIHPDYKWVVLVGVLILGGGFIDAYRRYLKPLFEASRYCNDVIGRRERTIVKAINATQLEGFSISGPINVHHNKMKQAVCTSKGGTPVECENPECFGDCDYDIWRRAKPSLNIILVGISSLILLAAVIAIATVDLRKEQPKQNEQPALNSVQGPSKTTTVQPASKPDLPIR